MSINDNTNESQEADHDRILAVVQKVWRKLLWDRKPITDLDESFALRLLDKAYDDLDVVDLAISLETELTYKELSFSVFWRCSNQAWEQYLGLVPRPRNHETWLKEIAPTLTFRSLIAFLKQRTCIPRIQPASVLGRECLPAGVFLELQKTAREVLPHGEAFGPSTPLRSQLRGRHLREFWARMRWKSDHALPPRNKTARDHTATLLSQAWCCGPLLLAILLGISGLCRLQWHWTTVPSMFAGLCATVATLFAIDRVFWIWSTLENPIPKKFRTFRDVATYIAQSVERPTSP